MLRRTMLATACASTLALIGCTTSASGTGLSSEAVAKFDALANGLAAIAGTEAGILGATPTQVAQINSEAQLAQAALAALQPGLALAAAQPSAQSIADAVVNVLTIAAGLPLPTSIAQIVLALRVLLPVAEAAAGLPAPAGVAARGMTPAAAQDVLEKARR